MSVDLAREVTEAIEEAGVSLLYGLPGGGNLDVVGAFVNGGGRFILAHSETAATIMAGVTAELTGYPGAVLVTKGPGLSSAVNGAAAALLDRQPIIIVSDCVTAGDEDSVTHQRLDQSQLMAAVTKASVRIGRYRAGAVTSGLVALAAEGRPGPVHLELDGSALDTEIPTAGAAGRVSPEAMSISALGEACELLGRARRPVVVAGVGAVALNRERRAETTAALRRFATRGNVPVLTSYKARGVVPDSSPLAAGVMTGATIEGDLLEAADLIVGVGFDPVELIPGGWRHNAPLILLSQWSAEDLLAFAKCRRVEVVGDIAANLDKLACVLATDWRVAAGAEYREAALERICGVARGELAPQSVIRLTQELAPDRTIATVDAGAHMLAAVPLWRTDEPGELLVSSGLATMGFALPAAIAAALVRPEQYVVCLTGDGGLGMALAELETLARLNLRVVVEVFNDAALSLIAMKQKPGNGDDSAVRFGAIDFAAVAAGCGLRAVRVGNAMEHREALRAAFGHDGPSLLDIQIDASGYRDLLETVRGSLSDPTVGAGR